MTHLLEFRGSDEWPEKEREWLESVGAVMLIGEIRVPDKWSAMLLPIEASIADLIRPPFCPWCRKKMKRDMKENWVKYTCPYCGGVEETTRIPPGEKDERSG